MLNKKKLYTFKNKYLILQGNRITSGDGLWDITITQITKTPSQKSTPLAQASDMNAIKRKNEAAQDLAK